jgi:hypothetical protein
MRKLLTLWIALAAIVAVTASSFAQGGMMPGPGTSHSAASFSGPLDVIASAKACYSLRACSSAARGSKAVNACNSTGGGDVCADLLTDATTGNLVAQTINSGTCPGTNCTIKIWYDQTAGNACTAASCDVSRTTVANRPTLEANILNTTLPAAHFVSASSQNMVGANVLTVAQPLTLSVVAEHPSGTASLVGVFTDGNNNGFFFSSTTGAVVLFAGAPSANVTAADNAFHTFESLLSSTSSSIFMDGTANTGLNPGTGGFGAIVNIGTTGFLPAGYVTEAIIWSGDQTASQTSLCHNQRLYFGTGGSC